MGNFRKKVEIILCMAAMLLVVSVLGFNANAGSITASAATSAGVKYQTHIQSYGWLTNVSDGATSGTIGKSKRMEAIKISLTNADYTGSIQYRTHVQSYGWQSWVSNGTMSGTSGQSKRVEAIQIKLTGEMANHYDVYYRAYAQSYGWLGWAKNGESAGTSGYSYRLEAIQIKLVAKGGAAPGSTDNAYRHPLVQYRTHVQSYGWQSYVSDGATSGTTGSAKRLEAINISLNEQDYTGSIQYRTHVQSYGWQSWVSNGTMSGTSGQSKRLEAIQIKLTGEMANKYDIYYRVHAQKFGWMGWAKNGESAGTSGYSYRLEAIQIKLVPKGSAAPGSTANAYKEYVKTVAVTGISLNKTSYTMKSGDTYTLTSTISPSTATDKTVKWSSSNTSVATVNSSGKVTAVKAGTATITASSTNGKTATCKITVQSATTEQKDTEQADQEEIYNELFDINNKVTITMDISDEQLKLMESDYKKGNEDTYRIVDKVTIQINDKKYEMYEVGVRLKGNTSKVDVYNGSNLDSRNMVHFKLSFKETFDDEEEYGSNAKVWSSDEARKARKKRTFATLKVLELKWNRNLDGTYVANYYVNQMYRAFGIYAQNTSLANVHFGGYNYGVYTMYEAVDENFLTRYFGEDNDGGDLYKCQWGLVDNGTGSNWKGAMYTNETINSMSPEETGKTFIYELKTNKKKSTQQSLKTLISKLNSDSSKTTFSSLVDADYFIKYAAVAYFAGNPDDMRNNYNNHYIYFTEDGLATVIPYDNDRCLGMTTSGKDMSSYSPYASETALQGTQANPLYNNSVIGRTSNYYTEYTEALKNVASSGWLDYSNYLKYYNIAKKNYSDVAIPDSNIKLYIKDLNDSTGKTYSNTALAFSESNSYNTSVKTYLTNILARYKEAINK